MAISKKIKAGLLFLSWVMIFAHGIIPHNHIDEDTSLPGFTHQQDNHSHGNNGLFDFRELCPDYETCHISNILFQKFSTDDFYSLPGTCEYLEVYLTESEINSFAVNIFPEESSSSTVLLRAPPAA